MKNLALCFEDRPVRRAGDGRSLGARGNCAAGEPGGSKSIYFAKVSHAF
jgi:hypothetical protein